MNSRSERYLAEALAFTGFALVSPAIAFVVRPDLWRSVQSAATDLNPGAQQWLASHAPILFRFCGEHCGYGGARSVYRIDERIIEVTGLNLRIELISKDELLGNKTLGLPSNQQAGFVAQDEQLQHLRELSAQEPPGHDCHKRREILGARHKLTTQEV